MLSKKIKAGILIFAEGKSREDVYITRKKAEEREVQRFLAALCEIEIVQAKCGSDIRDKHTLLEAVRQFTGEDLDACILFVATFAPASLVAMALRLLKIPCVLMGNEAVDSFSQVGYLAAVGAAEQAGVEFKRLPGDIMAVKRKLMDYLLACHAKKQMEGLTFGMFGGRSLGITTGTADAAQWMKLFGIDIEHVDQMQIVEEAQKIASDEVERYRAWIMNTYGCVRFDQKQFTKNHFERMIRSYLAVKKLVREKELDLIGIKCQPELSNGYVLQCLTVQLLNDPYDADGEKETIVCSCEADCDGALTMQILKYLSGGAPAALQDVFLYDEQKIVLANCGSSASFFANGKGEGKLNLQEVHLIPHGFGKAGGASTQFCFAPGQYTYARLFRKNGKYCMAYGIGQAEKMKREDLQCFCWYRPTAVVHGIDRDIFAEHFCCNHIHCVMGDYKSALLEYCRLMDIETLSLNKED